MHSQQVNVKGTSGGNTACLNFSSRPITSRVSTTPQPSVLHFTVQQRYFIVNAHPPFASSVPYCLPSDFFSGGGGGVGARGGGGGGTYPSFSGTRSRGESVGCVMGFSLLFWGWRRRWRRRRSRGSGRRGGWRGWCRSTRRRRWGSISLFYGVTRWRGWWCIGSAQSFSSNQLLRFQVEG